MESEAKSDDGRPELESPVFTVCTLNVGGRNTNSFEFEMRGDLTELGETLGVPRCCGAFTPSMRIVSIRRGRKWFLFRV